MPYEWENMQIGHMFKTLLFYSIPCKTLPDIDIHNAPYTKTVIVKSVTPASAAQSLGRGKYGHVAIMNKALEMLLILGNISILILKN